METIADRLKAERGKRGWSGPELASKAKISQSFIGALETGRQKSSSKLPAIAHALGVDLYWLMTGVETIIAGDKRINEVVRLMESMATEGRAVVLNEARKMAKEYPATVNGNLAA